MNNIDYFWEVPGFWPMVAVLLLVAATAALAICFGPTEAPYNENLPALDAADIEVKTAWGISSTAWENLTDRDRAYYREQVVHAPSFTSEGK